MQLASVFVFRGHAHSADNPQKVDGDTCDKADCEHVAEPIISLEAFFNVRTTLNAQEHHP